MLQDVGEAQLGGSLDSLGLQLLLRPETKSYTRFCPGGFPQCPRPASCCWTDHLWEKQSFAEGGDVMVLKWLRWWYTPGVNEGREWIDRWLTTKVRCFCSELNKQMSRLAWNDSKSASSRIKSPSLQWEDPRTDLVKFQGTNNFQARLIGHNAHVCQFKLISASLWILWGTLANFKLSREAIKYSLVGFVLSILHPLALESICASSSTKPADKLKLC